MHDKELYATILGVISPWAVREVEVRAGSAEVEVFIEHALCANVDETLTPRRISVEGGVREKA